MFLKRTKLLFPLAGITLVLSVWFSSAFAAVDDFTVRLKYNNSLVPPPAFRNFPGGLSLIDEDTYLLKFDRIKLNWQVNVTEFVDYVRLTRSFGKFAVYNPIFIDFDSYVKYSSANHLRRQWAVEMAGFSGTQGKPKAAEGIQIPINIGNVPKPVRSIIGEGGPRITVTGSRRIAFSGRSEWEDNLVNTGTFKQSKFPSLHMEQTSRFKIKGDIGSKLSIEVDQDSNRDQELANTLKLRYKGEQDDILQTIEAGNTNLSLPNAQLIGFSQNVQGLFGIKATAKVGNTELTLITSQEKGASEKATFQAGAQGSQDTIFDYAYLHNVYFWLGRPGEFNPLTDSLLRVVLYRKGGPQPTQHDAYGKACVDPHFGPNPEDTGGNDTLYYTTAEELGRSEFVQSHMLRLNDNDYDLNRAGWFITLHQAISDQTGDFLAAYIEYVRKSAPFDTLREGNLRGDTLVLKLIKPINPDSSFATWDLEWRNVYDLRARDLTETGFELQIYKGHGNLNTDTTDQNQVCYITLLGLDSLNNSTRARTPDCQFDFVSTVIDAGRGHLIFPMARPFDSPVLNTRNPSIYDLPYDNASRANNQTYYLYVKSSKRSTTFSLGRTNIIENSDVVRLGNGQTLQRGVDYSINYDLGQITFMNQEALNPNNNVSIDFEYAPFFLAEKKSFYGLSAKYNINDKSWLSWAGMYRKESAREYRPRVGREPRSSMIWDSNFIFGFTPGFLTKAVDFLPFIETETASRIDISGEIAQSFPNPNLRNDAYIDDFEGSRDYTDLMTRRGIWTTASVPVGMNLADKRKLWWYNPYTPYLLTDIWPERSVRDQDNRTDVLILRHSPNSDTILNPQSAWSGIMRPLFSGMNDQSLTQFIEIWYQPDTTYDGSEHPIFHIDIGKISEDLDGDGSTVPYTEDLNRNGIFEQNEDVGLDGIPSVQEPGYDQATNPDPNGDDWSYKTGTNAERNDFSRINGTEGNRNDPDRLNRFDTEDINNNTYTDLVNSYFSYTVDLVEPDTIVADSTRTGWKLLRIPLQDSTAFTSVGNANLNDFSQVKFIRLWISGASQQYLLKLASIQLVGNKWRKAPLRPEESNITFEVTVKNTQENIGYTSPPGVIAQSNRETGVVEKEQSLVLRYEDLRPGQSVRAYWYLYQPEDYTLYSNMKMFVHGDNSAAGRLIFFFRMGVDTSRNNYYEYRTALSEGWAESNHVDIDFAELTALKTRRPVDYPDSVAYQEGPYLVKGNPSLSSIRCFVVGVYNDSLAADTQTVSGETWCDELRVTGVRRNSDFAGRLGLAIGLADFVSISANYNRQGADYVRLLDKKPGGSLSITQSVSTTVNVDKLAPPSWQLKLPVTYNWQQSRQLPRLMPSSDIILPPELREFYKSESRSWSVSAREQFRRNTKNWLWNWTLNRFTVGGTYGKQSGLNPTTPVSRTTTYNATGSYDLAPRSHPTVKLFYWTKYLFLPAGIHAAQLSFLPTTLKFDGSVNSTRSFSVNQRGIKTSSYVRDLALTQNYGFDLFSSLKTNFTITSNRDISNPATLKFAYDPRNITLGRERTFSQRFDVSFSPRITAKILPRFQFNSNYSDNSDFSRSIDTTKTAQVGATLRGDLSLDLVNLFGLKKSAAGKAPSPPKVPPTATESGEPAGEEEEAEEFGPEKKKTGKPFKLPNPLKIFKPVLNTVRSLKPLTLNYTFDKKMNQSGLYRRPGWKYTLGFADDPGVPKNTVIGLGTREQKIYNQDYSIGSGIAPLTGVDIGVSYKYRIGITRTTTDPVKNSSLEFPRIDVNISGVEKFPLFRKFAKMATMQSNYSRKIDRAGHADTGQKYSRNIADSYTPLLAVNTTLPKDIRITARYDFNKKKSENLRTEGINQRTSYSQDRAIKVSLGYSLTAPRGINIPIFGKLKFESQLTLSLDYNKRFNKNWSIQNSQKTIESDRVETSVEPKASYRFSAKITGGLQARWVDSNDKIQQRKRHIRELGIWTELRF